MGLTTRVAEGARTLGTTKDPAAASRVLASLNMSPPQAEAQQGNETADTGTEESKTDSEDG